MIVTLKAKGVVEKRKKIINELTKLFCCSNIIKWRVGNMNYKKMWSEVITASLIIIISAIAIISFIVISGQDVDIYNPSDKIAVSKGTDKISEVLTLLQSKYMGDLDVDSLIDGAINGIFENIDDPYTRYLTPDEFDEAVNSGNEEYYGIGIHISLTRDSGEARIVGVMPNTPAKKAGIHAGDIIKKVDDIIVNENNYYEASNAIKGAEGTAVKLVLERNGKELEFNVIRSKIVSSDISSSLINDNIGYIKIFSFEQGVYDNFKSEYNNMIKDQKVKGLIIDLRDNPGGFVDETVRIADLLCGSGTIIKQEYGDGTTRLYTSNESKCEVPLVVLVNENSASASEILAGSIKDLKAGKLVGTTTFGKGIMQSYIALQNGGGVAITVAKYYTASGTEIHGQGITPNVEKTLNEGQTIDYSANPKTDAQLQVAIETLEKMQ